MRSKEIAKKDLFRGIGDQNFILRNLEDFWRKKTGIVNMPLVKPSFRGIIREQISNIFRSNKGDGVMGLLLGLFLGGFMGYLTIEEDPIISVISLFTGFLGGIIIELIIRACLNYGLEYRQFKTAEKKIMSDLKDRRRKFLAGTDSERAEQIVEWLDDPDQGLLANLRRQTESARGDASGFAENEKARLEDRLSSIKSTAKIAEYAGLTEQVEELNGLRQATAERLSSLSTDQTVVELQLKFQDAKNRVDSVQGIAGKLKALIPIERTIEKLRTEGDLEGYQSVNLTSIAGQSLQAAMDKLEEVIVTAEQVESGLNDTLPGLQLTEGIQTPVEKLLGC